MDARAIALSVPVFFILICAELLVLRKRQGVWIPFHDAICSLSCGVGQQVIELVLLVVMAAGYGFVYEHFRLTEISPRSPAAWIVLLFAVDLCYYAYHRASHRVNFLWATHVVHHQSEEYNLTTALRQTWFTGFTSWIFYLPLALLGFPTTMVVVMITIDTVFQFWIHTRTVNKLGWAEAVLNTPSHHRVHHGINPAYLDKNYAGIFIVWDRLFGTFEPEVGEPVYGTVGPLASFNPFWANIEPWVKLITMARKTRRLRDKIYVFFAPPEWRPADLGGPVTVVEPTPGSRRKYDKSAPRGLDVYVGVTFAANLIGATALLALDQKLSEGSKAIGAAAVMLGLLTPGAIIEARSWAVSVEWVRLALLVPLALWATRGTAFQLPVAVAVGALAAALGLWLGRYRNRRPEIPAPVDSEGGSDPLGKGLLATPAPLSRTPL